VRPQRQIHSESFEMSSRIERRRCKTSIPRPRKLTSIEKETSTRCGDSLGNKTKSPMPRGKEENRKEKYLSILAAMQSSVQALAGRLAACMHYVPIWLAPYCPSFRAKCTNCSNRRYQSNCRFQFEHPQST